MRRRAAGALAPVTPTADGRAFLRNFLRPCLLLALADGPAHGYDLLEQVTRSGLERVDPGGIYRSLRSMEQEGLLQSWWEPSRAGPARRTYALTDGGLEALHASAESLRGVRRVLHAFLDRYEAVAEVARSAR